MKDSCSIEKEWPEEELNIKRTLALENMFMLTPEENEMLKAEESTAYDEMMLKLRESWLANR